MGLRKDGVLPTLVLLASLGNGENCLNRLSRQRGSLEGNYGSASNPPKALSTCYEGLASLAKSNRLACALSSR